MYDQPPATELTALLARWRRGEAGGEAELMPVVYGELRRLAARAMRGERGDHTLQPTALVHEAYLRLAAGARPQWRDRVHFYAVAARTMRRVLVDHARRQRAARRGGGAGGRRVGALPRLSGALGHVQSPSRSMPSSAMRR